MTYAHGLMIGNCESCAKRWTRDCPIRVWGRNEGNSGDTNPDDFCSRYAPKRCDLCGDIHP